MGTSLEGDDFCRLSSAETTSHFLSTKDKLGGSGKVDLC